MTTNQQSKRPATTLRCGNNKSMIRQNVSEKEPFYFTTFSRLSSFLEGVTRVCHRLIPCLLS